MKKIFFILLFAFALINCRAEGCGISQIIVLNSDFQRICVVNQPDLIKQLNNLWKELEPIDELPNTRWTHKLDIESKCLGGRWLYNQAGYIAKLNYELKPRYKINKNEAFNKIILGL